MSRGISGNAFRRPRFLTRPPFATPFFGAESASRSVLARFFCLLLGPEVDQRRVLQACGDKGATRGVHTFLLDFLIRALSFDIIGIVPLRARRSSSDSGACRRCHDSEVVRVEKSGASRFSREQPACGECSHETRSPDPSDSTRLYAGSS